jgi:2-methylisocitrate lyase-like PEP mutase family enzyme
MTATDRAKAFRSLHSAVKPLLLPNAWDAGSARLIESLGAEAIATTSAGVAWSHGYPDGDVLPLHLLAATVAAIRRVIHVPLTVDIEGGYSDDLDAVEEVVTAVLDAGAVGINIEDGVGSPELLCAKIERARRAGSRVGVPVFVNARTDVYLAGLTGDELRIAETLKRGQLYREAGADGLFVPLLIESEEIRVIASSAGLPLNVLAWPGLPDLEALTGLGVKRLSAGSGIARILYAQGAAVAAAFLSTGRLAGTGETSLAYADVNSLMKR